MTRLSEEQYNEIMQRRGVKPSAPAIEIEILGNPTGKARPRVTKFVTYTPDKTLNYENLVRWIYKEKYKDLMLDGPLTAKVEIFYPIPKSTSKKKKAEMLDGLILPTKKPDIDNICKIIFDALNLIAYKDDTQIVELYTIKHYAETAKVIVTIDNFTIQTKIEV